MFEDSITLSQSITAAMQLRATRPAVPGGAQDALNEVTPRFRAGGLVREDRMYHG